MEDYKNGKEEDRKENGVFDCGQQGQGLHQEQKDADLI